MTSLERIPPGIARRIRRVRHRGRSGRCLARRGAKHGGHRPRPTPDRRDARSRRSRFEGHRPRAPASHECQGRIRESRRLRPRPPPRRLELPRSGRSDGQVEIIGAHDLATMRTRRLACLAGLRPSKNPPRSLRAGECNLTVKLNRGRANQTAGRRGPRLATPSCCGRCRAIRWIDGPRCRRVPAACSSHRAWRARLRQRIPGCRPVDR